MNKPNKISRPVEISKPTIIISWPHKIALLSIEK
jgi:hypothetical protein